MSQCNSHGKTDKITHHLSLDACILIYTRLGHNYRPSAGTEYHDDLPSEVQLPKTQKSCLTSGLFICLFVCSTIFQSYQDGVWLQQGAQCSLL